MAEKETLGLDEMQRMGILDKIKTLEKSIKCY
jgi:hypothetical protein